MQRSLGREKKIVINQSEIKNNLRKFKKKKTERQRSKQRQAHDCP